MLVHCNILNNNHRQNSVLYTFLPSKYFVQLINISPKSFIFWKKFWLRIFIYRSMVHWSNDQTSKPLEMEKKKSITLVINQSITYEKGAAIQFNRKIKYL